MLVLTRRLNERIFIGDNIVITLIDIDRGKVRIGIDAPSDLRVDREEIRIAREKNNENKP